MTKLYKNWTAHNLIGHPLMAIAYLVGLNDLGAKIHDATLPPETGRG
jgi:hypothetical protein